MDRPSHAFIHLGFTASVVGASALALVVGFWSLSFEKVTAHRERRSRSAIGIAVFAHPLTQWILTCLAVWLNQIVFNAYVAKVHAGDPRFLARYLGSGWCAVDGRDPLVRLVADHITSGEPHPILALSVLRVQAFLELPFTIFAYLAVTRLLSPRLYRSLTQLRVLLVASIFFTVPFCLAEVGLANPWTVDDLVIRAAASLVVPFYVTNLRRLEQRNVDLEPEPVGVLGCLTFLTGAGAIALMVLAVYDAFLIYNFAHLRRYHVTLGAGTAIAVLATIAAPRIDRIASRFFATAPKTESKTLAAFRAGLIAFTALFFVPSLSIRYYAGHPIAQLAGIGIIFGGVIVGLVVAVRSTHPVRVTLSAVVGMAAGVLVLVATLPFVDFGTELAFAQVALALLAPAIVMMRLTEIAAGLAGASAVSG